MLIYKQRWIGKTWLMKNTFAMKILWGEFKLNDTLMVVSPNNSVTKTIKEWLNEWGYTKIINIVEGRNEKNLL